MNDTNLFGQDLTLRQALRRARFDYGRDREEGKRRGGPYNLEGDETLHVVGQTDDRGDLLIGVYVAIRYDKNGFAIARYRL